MLGPLVMLLLLLLLAVLLLLVPVMRLKRGHCHLQLSMVLIPTQHDAICALAVLLLQAVAAAVKAERAGDTMKAYKRKVY